MKKGIAEPCKICGTQNKYLDSRGYSRCKICQRNRALEIAQRKKATGQSNPCKTRGNTGTYYSNFGSVVCNICRRKTAKLRYKPEFYKT